jgi:hypothetical protein
MIRYLFEPGGRLTLTWKDGRTSQFSGNKAACIIVFYFPVMFWDLMVGNAEMIQKDEVVEIIWKN